MSITGYPVPFLGIGPGPGRTGSWDLGTGPGPGSIGSQFRGPGTRTDWEPVPNQVPGYIFRTSTDSNEGANLFVAYSQVLRLSSIFSSTHNHTYPLI